MSVMKAKYVEWALAEDRQKSLRVSLVAYESSVE